MNNPLINPHILELIFTTCKVPTLLQCRLVCRIWNEEANRLLVTQITGFIKGERGVEDFTNCIRSSDDHPYSRLSIELPSEEETSVVHELFELLNHRLKYLKLEYDPPTIIIPSSEQMEELDQLSLQEIDDTSSTVSEEPNSESASATNISGSESEANYPPNGYETNPQAVGNTSLDSSVEVDLTINLPKLETLHIFSSYLYPPSSPEGHTLPQLFSNLIVPNLRSLCVQHLFDTDCVEAVVKILSVNRRGGISSLKFPCDQFAKLVSGTDLSSLRELDLCDLFHASFAVNHTIQAIIKACPNLEKLCVEFGFKVTFDCTFKLFQAIAHSIKQLKLIIQDRNILARANVQRYNFYFPNMPQLTSLFLRYSNSGLVYYIDQLPQLSSLELETPWSKKIRGNIFPGIEDRTYEKLRCLTVSEVLGREDVLKISSLFPKLKTLVANFENDEAIATVYQSMTGLESLMIDRRSCITDSGVCGVNVEDWDWDAVAEEGCSVLQEGQKVFKVGNLINLKTLKLVQAGLSWKSVVHGVAELRGLESLTVQTSTLKVKELNLNENDVVLKVLMEFVSGLKQLNLWIRRNAERLNQIELHHLETNFPQLETQVVTQIQCGS